MAKNRKNQSAAIRFGPALKALFLCLIIAGSAVGYVWQKSQIYQLGKQIRQTESRLTQLARDNKKLEDQLGLLRSPVLLDQRVRDLKLGLVPVLPGNVFRLPETPVGAPEIKNSSRLLAARSADAASQ
jgi:cell division protein FtsB